MSAFSPGGDVGEFDTDETRPAAPGGLGPIGLNGGDNSKNDLDAVSSSAPGPSGSDSASEIEAAKEGGEKAVPPERSGSSRPSDGSASEFDSDQTYTEPPPFGLWVRSMVRSHPGVHTTHGVTAPGPSAPLNPNGRDGDTGAPNGDGYGNGDDAGDSESSSSSRTLFHPPSGYDAAPSSGAKTFRRQVPAPGPNPRASIFTGPPSITHVDSRSRGTTAAGGGLLAPRIVALDFLVEVRRRNAVRLMELCSQTGPGLLSRRDLFSAARVISQASHRLGPTGEPPYLGQSSGLQSLPPDSRTQRPVSQSRTRGLRSRPAASHKQPSDSSGQPSGTQVKPPGTSSSQPRFANPPASLPTLRQGGQQPVQGWSYPPMTHHPGPPMQQAYREYGQLSPATALGLEMRRASGGRGLTDYPCSVAPPGLLPPVGWSQAGYQWRDEYQGYGQPHSPWSGQPAQGGSQPSPVYWYAPPPAYGHLPPPVNGDPYDFGWTAQPPQGEWCSALGSPGQPIPAPLGQPLAGIPWLPPTPESQGRSLAGRPKRPPTPPLEQPTETLGQPILGDYTALPPPTTQGTDPASSEPSRRKGENSSEGQG